MKKVLVLIPIFLLAGCVSAEEQRAAQARLEQVIVTQCVDTVGFKKGTKEYAECRAFYAAVLPDEGIYNGVGVSAVAGFAKEMQQTNEKCMQFLETTTPKAGEIWPCVKETQRADADRKARQRELQEYQQTVADYQYRK